MPELGRPSCVGSLIPGPSGKQGLVTFLIALAREKGVSAYVGDGLNAPRNPVRHLKIAPLPTMGQTFDDGLFGGSSPRYRIRKFGSWERSQELDAQVGAAGRGEGIAFNFDRMGRTPNTIDSHRIIWLAGERGVQDAVVEALFQA